MILVLLTGHIDTSCPVGLQRHFAAVGKQLQVRDDYCPKSHSPAVQYLFSSLALNVFLCYF